MGSRARGSRPNARGVWRYRRDRASWQDLSYALGAGVSEIRATSHHLGGTRIARMRGGEGLIVHNSIVSPSNGVRDILDRVLSSYEEIDGRFTAVGGLGRLLNLYEQLQRELERVSYEE